MLIITYTAMTLTTLILIRLICDDVKMIKKIIKKWGIRNEKNDN